MKVLPVVLLLASATAISAQEPVRAVRAEPVPATAPAPAKAAAETAAQPKETKTESLVLRKSSFEQVRTVPAESAARQTIPHNWWWTVGAIVLAGIILALIL
jgi:hypothetical protein